MDTSYEIVAAEMLNIRNGDIGVEEIRAWSSFLQEGDDFLDLGCAHGLPIGVLFKNRGLNIHAIDSSPTLLREYEKNLSEAETACESVVNSQFFNQQFNGILASGLLFLLTGEDQETTLSKACEHLKPGGQLLFTSPWQVCKWDDLLTGRESISLGGDRYREILLQHGVEVKNEFADGGGNYYYAAVRS